MKRIGLLTSGGDAPGMNAAIRAIVRMAGVRGVAAIGIRDGYTGLIAGEMEALGPRDVSNLIQQGGTMLGTSRSESFMTPEGRERSASQLTRHGIDGLIVIGGDGSFRGAHALAAEQGIKVIGVPGTIDNDVFGSDYTIGYDTAINTALEAIDKIRDTAASHSRIFVVEVMGRRAGFIALEVALGGGAEEAVIPEEACTLDGICERLRTGIDRGKSSSIIVVSEAELGGAVEIAHGVEERLGVEAKTTVLGHIQRGGRPTARDRVLASRLGAAAVDALLAGESDRMSGEVGGTLTLTPLRETWEKRKPVPSDLLQLARHLAT